MGAQSPGASVPPRRNICGAMDSAKRCDAVIEEYKDWRDPLFTRKDIFALSPRMADFVRASLVELRSALLRVKKHLPPANTSGQEEVLGQGSEAPSDGTSLFLTSAQMCGSGTRAEQVASGSVARTCIGRAPHLRYEYLLGSGAQSMDRASGYPRRVAKETGIPLVRAAAQERESVLRSVADFVCPVCSLWEGIGAPLVIRPEGLAAASGILRTLSRMAQDAVRVETPP